jgi:serine/threonine protein kinase
VNTTLPQSGEVFDFRYLITCRLGCGADGYVFGATELETGRRVAIKCWIGPHAEDALAAAQHFVRTAYKARLFDNPHITHVFAAEAGRTVGYCVMDWLEGVTLATRMARRRPSPLSDVFNIAMPCMRAVAEAHAAGIVHGDIRPGHIFVCHATRHRPAVARVFDFGRGFIWLASEPHIARAATDEAMQYAPPERLVGAAVDTRCDIYGFGLMLFEMLAGERAFRGDDPETLTDNIRRGSAKLLASISPSIPMPLAQVVERAIASDPDLRFPNLVEMIEALEPFDPRPPRAFVSIPSELATSAPRGAASEVAASSSALALPPRVSPTPSSQPAASGRIVVPAVPLPPHPSAPWQDISTTSATWELTEPIPVGALQGGLFARIPKQRVVTWGLVLFAAVVSARTTQLLLQPARNSAPVHGNSASTTSLEPPACYSASGASDPRCPGQGLPQPTAAVPDRTDNPARLDAGMHAPARMHLSETGAATSSAPSIETPPAGSQKPAAPDSQRIKRRATRSERARAAAAPRETPASSRKRSAGASKPEPRPDDTQTMDRFERLDSMHLQ